MLRYMERVTDCTHTSARARLEKAVYQGRIALDTGACRYILYEDLLVTAEPANRLDYYNYMVTTVLTRDMEVRYIL